MSDAPRKPPKLPSDPEPAVLPEPETPSRQFQFKTSEYERANRPADATPGNAPITVQQHLRRAAAPMRPAVATPPKAENDVHHILRANLAKDNARGLNQVVPERRRPSRRKRDYWLLLIGGNLLVLASLAVLHRNPVTLVFGFSAMVFCSLALTWIMWMVLDDY